MLIRLWIDRGCCRCMSRVVSKTRACEFASPWFKRWRYTECGLAGGQRGKNILYIVSEKTGCVNKKMHLFDRPGAVILPAAKVSTTDAKKTCLCAFRLSNLWQLRLNRGIQGKKREENFWGGSVTQAWSAVAQAAHCILCLLDSSRLPTSCSLVAGTTGMHPYAQLTFVETKYQLPRVVSTPELEICPPQPPKVQAQPGREIFKTWVLGNSSYQPYLVDDTCERKVKSKPVTLVCLNMWMQWFEQSGVCPSVKIPDCP